MLVELEGRETRMGTESKGARDNRMIVYFPAPRGTASYSACRSQLSLGSGAHRPNPRLVAHPARKRPNW